MSFCSVRYSAGRLGNGEVVDCIRPVFLNRFRFRLLVAGGHHAVADLLLGSLAAAQRVKVHHTGRIRQCSGLVVRHLRDRILESTVSLAFDPSARDLRRHILIIGQRRSRQRILHDNVRIVTMRGHRHGVMHFPI